MVFSRNRICSRPLIIPGALGLTIASSMSSVASAQDVTIPVIVRDITSSYWQTVLAGARKAKTELGINVPEFGVQSESDINEQITLLENAVASGANAVVIAPIEFIAVGGAVDQAAGALPVVGIDSPANSKAFSSFLTTDNEQGGRLAADDRVKTAYAASKGKRVEKDVDTGANLITAANMGEPRHKYLLNSTVE